MIEIAGGKPVFVPLRPSPTAVCATHITILYYTVYHSYWYTCSLDIVVNTGY